MDELRVKGGLPVGHNWEEYYAKFKRAKHENTLCFMYKAAEKKINNLPFNEKIIEWIRIDLYFAFSKRQEDFDRVSVIKKEVLRRALEAADRDTMTTIKSLGIPSMDLDRRSPCNHQQKLHTLSPEKQLSYLLNAMSS